MQVWLSMALALSVRRGAAFLNRLSLPRQQRLWLALFLPLPWLRFAGFPRLFLGNEHLLDFQSDGIGVYLYLIQ
jgi:hypothetical protein